MIQLLFEAQFNQVFDGARLDVGLEKPVVVSDQLTDCDFCSEAVSLSRDHGLSEEEIYPLGHIILVRFVRLDAMLEESVAELADQSDRVQTGQLIDLTEAEHERKDKAVDDQIDESALAHDFLAERHWAAFDRIMVDIVVFLVYNEHYEPFEQVLNLDAER